MMVYGREGPLYDLYGEAYTPFEWHQQLFDYANEIGITLFSSPFDETMSIFSIIKCSRI